MNILNAFLYLFSFANAFYYPDVWNQCVRQDEYLDCVGNVMEEVLSLEATPKGVTFLRLSGNGIKEIKSSSDIGTTSESLLGICIENNPISFIENDAFKAYPSLRELIIKNSLLKTIPNAVRRIDLLFKLDLSDNPIKEYGSGSFDSKHLKAVNLSKTQLTWLDKKFFNTLSGVKELLLNDLPLEQPIEPTIFTTMTSLVHLELRNSNLEDFPESIVKTLPMLRTLDIFDNIFTCGCSILWLSKEVWIQRFWSDSITYQQFMCRDKLNLQLYTLSNSNIKDFCKASLWSEWSPCPSSCTDSFKYQSRSIDCEEGGDCEKDGKLYETRLCKLNGCSIVEGWSLWSSWSPCSLTCGNGKVSRQRLCYDPELKNGLCLGDSLQFEPCIERLCSVNASVEMEDGKNFARIEMREITTTTQPLNVEVSFGSTRSAIVICILGVFFLVLISVAVYVKCRNRVHIGKNAFSKSSEKDISNLLSPSTRNFLLENWKFLYKHNKNLPPVPGKYRGFFPTYPVDSPNPVRVISPRPVENSSSIPDHIRAMQIQSRTQYRHGEVSHSTELPNPPQRASSEGLYCTINDSAGPSNVTHHIPKIIQSNDDDDLYVEIKQSHHDLHDANEEHYQEHGIFFNMF